MMDLQWPDFGCEGIKVQRAQQPTSTFSIQKINMYCSSFNSFPNSHKLSQQLNNRQHLLLYKKIQSKSYKLTKRKNQIVSCSATNQQKEQTNETGTSFSYALQPPGSEFWGEDDDVLECPTLRQKLKPLPSPFTVHNNFGGGFVNDGDKVALQSMKFASHDSIGASCQSTVLNIDGTLKMNYMEASMDQACVPLPPWAIRAGARETIYFKPTEVTAAVVTCGGLCPGLNDVVQGIVKKLTQYGVPEGNIWGIRYGFRGFYDKKDKPIILTKETVEGIHLKGGTILGTSRGGSDIHQIVKRLDMWGVDMVFVIGGNGGNAGASAIQQMCDERNVRCAVIGVPKSIDNDILLIDKCFGFDTAVEEAQRALLAAKVEASSARHGIGLVKLMGRQSGFIAMLASLASGVVDVCLIPEVRFELEGPHGLKRYINNIVQERGHCVICIAEGAGQDLMEAACCETDASGNPVLSDTGV
eukprot:TRINITY_DN2418_c0_g2_i7.p1 TRINITY_DN2418_c0_g2~~TRINITY_DN2418_c0_g2_i7.p1  ORF type:complete len:471 (-),score=61.02 TRINITY_DN2418_c0_g2_i7:52-1464(-)